MYVIIHLSKPMECATLGMNLKISYGLWVIMMYHYRVIICNKCVTLVGDTDNKGGGVCAGVGSIWEV